MAALPQTEPQVTASAGAPAELATRVLLRVYTLNWEALAYVLIFILALLSRFIDLGAGAMSHDESLHTKYSWYLYQDGNYAHDPMMHGPLLFHVTALFYALFGDSDFSARIYPALLGVALVMIPLLYRKWVGRTTALLASVMFLFSPYILYYSRYIRHDIPAIVYALLMIWAAFSYIDDKAHSFRWLYIIAVNMILLLASKEVAFMYIAIVGLFLVVFFCAQLIQRFVHQADSRLIFDVVMIGVILGALIALGLIVVFTIIPPDTWANEIYHMVESDQLDADTGQPIMVSQPVGTTYGARARVWVALVIVPVALLCIGLALLHWLMHLRSGVRIVSVVLAVFLIAAPVAGIVVALEDASHIEATDTGVSEPAQPGTVAADGVMTTASDKLVKYGPLILIDALVILLAGALAVLSRMMGWWTRFIELPVFAPLMIMGTLVLPWLTAFAIYLQGEDPTAYDDYWLMILNFVPFLAVSVIVGIAWDWRWVIAAGIFYALCAFFFTTMFTNGRGMISGVIGSLGYWLGQQDDRRGSQPQYFYVLQTVFYEFLPLLGAMGAGVLGLNRFFQKLAAPGPAAPAAREGDIIERPTPVSALALRRVPVMTFFGYLAVANFIVYTYSGEKMPWLTTHLSTPMIFLAAWFFAWSFDKIDWRAFMQCGWALLALAPLMFFATWRLLLAIFEPGKQPFLGSSISWLYLTGEWLAALATFAGGLAVTVYVMWRAGVAQVARVLLAAGFIFLLLLTGRVAWMAAYINYDSPKEFMFYAHASEATKRILHMIEDVSLKTTGGMDLIFAYDDINSWPMSWYFRDFPNARFYGHSPSVQTLDDAKIVIAGDANIGKVAPLLQDRYYRYEYNRMVWPMQDYFGITLEKIDHLFAPDGAQLRRGLFDIWWSRDYATFALAIGHTPDRFNINNWPVAQKTAVFVRKDIAALTWIYGIGETAQIETGLEDPYARNTLTLDAQASLGEALGLNAPRGMALDAEGNLYVADSGNHRIVVLSPDGKLLRTVGGPNPDYADGMTGGAGYLNQPWGVAVAEDGTIFVADTWNHRIQAFSPEGEYRNEWGYFGSVAELTGSDAYAFYGPRNVVVYDDEVYVVDTGNKRVRVYDLDGNFMRDIGSGGMLPGQLSEPVGLALDESGNLIIADTWNRRVQVFDHSGGYLLDWRVEAWYGLAGELRSGNLPFIAYDDRGNVYVPDPDTCRVIVFNKTGTYRYRFGQCGTETYTMQQFNTLGGLAVNDKYQLYVIDPGANRILRYDLAQEPALEPPEANP